MAALSNPVLSKGSLYVYHPPLRKLLIKTMIFRDIFDHYAHCLQRRRFSVCTIITLLKLSNFDIYQRYKTF